MFYIVLCKQKGTYFGTVVERGIISSNYLDTLKRNHNQFCKYPEPGWTNGGRKVSCICTYLVKNITKIARGKKHY